MVERELIFKAPIEKVFAVISDFKSYPDFLTGTQAVRIKSTEPEELVEFEVNVIKPIRYTIRVKKNPPYEMSWDFVEGEVMKKNSGFWKLKAVSPQETQVHYGVDVGFGWMVPKMIVDQLTKVQLPLMLEAFQKRAEAQA